MVAVLSCDRCHAPVRSRALARLHLVIEPAGHAGRRAADLCPTCHREWLAWMGDGAGEARPLAASSAR